MGKSYVLDDEFRGWLAQEGLVASSVSTRISDLRRLEKHYGNLDEAYAEDGCSAIFERLAYTSADQAAGKPNPSGLEIDGNLYDNLSGYKSSLMAYLRFLKDRPGANPASQADRIRRFVAENYADPARKRNEREFTVISGDIHRDMSLSNAMPAVCNALDSRKFAEVIHGELVNRSGPAHSSTVSFTFRFRDVGSLSIDAAERELRRRYGEPMPTIKDGGNQKIVSFELSDKRQIALERTGQSVRIWFEGNAADAPTLVDACTGYLPEQGRQANLPSRLKHNPPNGAAPRAVTRIAIADAATLTKVLDWYDQKGAQSGALTREAILAVLDECDQQTVDGFLRKHGFALPRTYWIAERGRHYPCKAIVNVALRALQGADAQIRDATRSREMAGRLGFKIVDTVGLVLDPAELEKLRRRFLQECPGFEPEGFPGSNAAYSDVVDYKRVAGAKALAALGNDVPEEERGGRLLDVLGETDLLGWRTNAHLKEVRKRHPGALESAAMNLIAAEAPVEQRIAGMVDAIWPAISEGQDKNRPFSESRNIPTMLLALVRPDEALGINTDPLSRVYRSLTGGSLFGNNPLTTDEYAEVLRFARCLFDTFEEWGWKPRDLWDVQSFIWIVKDPSSEESDHTTAHEQKAQRPMPKPTNLILYGPPGTGKTYHTAQEAVRLCDGSAPEGREAIKARYDALVEAGQIRLVTFHQSYSYEDFVEGLRPVTDDGPDEEEGAPKAGFRLEPKRGIFREMCAVADDARKNAGRRGGFDLAGRRFFKMSLGRAGQEEHIFDAAIDGNYVVLGWGGEVDWSGPEYDDWSAILTRWQVEDPEATGYDPNVVQMWPFRSAMKQGDLIIVSAGNSHFRAIGEVVGPYSFEPSGTRTYNHRRQVRWLLLPDEPLPAEMIYGKKFMMQSCYQLKDNLVNKEALTRLLPGDEISEDQAPDQFVLIIDEINRANISKVFGELITLIEEDKRAGAANALTVRLPYSGDPFSVPVNLHIVGTMNTADRSIALLDTALRRRFTFNELMPDPSVLEEASQTTGINLMAVLRTLNQRIEYLFDREHQIGHAYFIGCRSAADVHEVMRHRVIPLLAEYFYEDWSKVALVLGDADGAGRFITRTQLNPPAGLQSDGFSEVRYRWKICDQFNDDVYDHFQ